MGSWLHFFRTCFLRGDSIGSVGAAGEELGAFDYGEDGGGEAGVVFFEAGLHGVDEGGVAGEDGAAEGVAEEFAGEEPGEVRLAGGEVFAQAFEAVEGGAVGEGGGGVEGLAEVVFLAEAADGVEAFEGEA